MWRRNLPRKALIAAVWLAVWWLAARAVGQALLLPSPWQTARALWGLAAQGSFWLAVGASMLRILAGFAAGMGLGVLLGAVTSHFRWWRDFLAPLLSVVRATPVASFIMLALVWIRTNGVPVFATVLIVLPIAWANVQEGFLATDANLMEMGRAFGLGPLARLRTIQWPTVGPYLRAAIATGMGMAWKGGVAAEVIATPRMSLGSYLYDAKIYLQTPNMFATTVVVVVLSILLEKAVVALAGDGGRRKP